MLAAILLALGPKPQGALPAVLFEHVNVVTCVRDQVRRDVTVYIDGGRIVSIGKRPKTLPTDALTVDGKGKYLIPGLWDMHVHGTAVPGFAGLYLANGVTGVRDMFDPSNETFKLRDDVAQGKAVGPRIVAAGRLVDGPNPIWPGSAIAGTPEEGRVAVDKVLKEGSDFVKVYSLLPRDAYFAIAEECKKRNIVFAGHVPESISAEEASDAGQKSFEHLYGILKSCSSRGDAMAHTRLIGLKPEEQREIINTLLDTYDEKRAQLLFSKLKKNKSWQCPTFAVLYSISHPKDPRSDIQSRFDYVPAWMKGFWKSYMEKYKDWTDENLALHDRYFRKQLEIVGKMQKAGVPILAGTDVMNPYCFPGFSLHDELVWLTKAGLKPGEALRAATINPAIYLGIEKDFGTAERGKVADLVLLDANPLLDIRNTTKIGAVFVRGKLLRREDLDKLMPKMPAAPAASPPAALGGIADDEWP